MKWLKLEMGICGAAFWTSMSKPLQVKSRVTPKINEAGPSRAMRPVRRVGWEWAVSFDPAAKSCVG